MILFQWLASEKGEFDLFRFKSVFDVLLTNCLFPECNAPVSICCTHFPELSKASSVTRLGDLLDFGQLFKAFGNNQFAQISHFLGLGNFGKGVKINHFSS